ncbi:MAG: adenosine kinase [Actinomycetota bacterium]|nr:adenosine kinase [Actinomycetota bacterium]
MTFDGRFSDNLVVEQLDKVALSFLVEDLQIRRGGVAGNIAFGLGNLGLRPLLVGAAGEDFEEYRSWLERHGVDCSGVRISHLHRTARFICTTDQNHAQIASFYTGAMAEAREIELGPLHETERIDLVLVGANDPKAMVRHTQECRERGIPFAADPSQQLSWSNGDMIRELIDGAQYLFCNDYEEALITQKTGWSDAEVLERVQIRVITHGKDGVVVDCPEGDRLVVQVAPEEVRVDPTGVGDAFRAGFLAGQSWDLGLRRSAQLGCLLATLVLETVGTQEYQLRRGRFLERMAHSYGDDAAADIEPHLEALRP